jgi:hypothetical protein
MARQNTGCAGIGCLGFGVVLLGFCGSLQDSPSYSPPSSPSSYGTPTVSTPAPPSETFHIHGEVNVRSGPGKEHPVVRTLSRGAAVQLGAADEKGWAELYAFGGTRDGYIYRKSELVRRTPPEDDRSPDRSASSGSGSTGRSSAESREYHKGPRGGCYRYTASGRKDYVERWRCN